MKNLIPKELKVGGRIFKVKQPHDSKQNAWGSVLYNSSEILIYRYGLKPLEKASKQTMEESFIHETIHAIDFVYNYDSLPEKVVGRLAEGLYEVLKDNFTIKAKGR